MKQYYKEQFAEQKQALLDRIDGMAMDPDATGKIKAQIQAMFNSRALKGPYFPLMRFGEFAVVATTKPTPEHPEGQPYRAHFESEKDMKSGIAELEKNGL